jgi:hypothetical protein
MIASAPHDPMSSPRKSTSDFFHMLAGVWDLERHITGSPAAEFHAIASFVSSQDQSLIYEESGMMTMPTGQKNHASMGYIYTLQNDAINITFKDGRPFLSLTFNDPARATCQHMCTPDQYDATYIIHDLNRFDINFSVRGPKKNYQSSSHYTRKI